MEDKEGFNFQLSSPAQLDKIDKLRDLGLGKSIDLPQLVVVGDQSSGKSSVLEAIMGLPLPRDSGLCTRFATNIVFRRTTRPNISVSIVSGPLSGDNAEEFSSFKKEGLGSLNGKQFLEILDEVCDFMQIKRSSDGREGKKSTFSKYVFKIELSGPDRDNLSIIDIPGIFRTTTEGITSEADILLVRNMVNSYIEDKRTIILAVMPVNTDIATQEILAMAKAVDPEGIRTLGVLTKPDLVDEGGEDHILDLMNGRRMPLRLGYCMVKNRSQKDMSTGPAERASKESLFFHTKPWSALDRRRVGVDSLKTILRDLLSDITRREFPKVQADIENRLTKRKRNLKVLGEDRGTTDQQRAYLQEIAINFQNVVNDALNADYARHSIFEQEDLRLPTLIVARSDVFSNMVQNRGHTVSFDRAESAEPSDNLGQGLSASFGKSAEEIPNPNQNAHLTAKPRSSIMELYAELHDVVQEKYESAKVMDKDIMKWIGDEYQRARGFGLDLMTPNILPKLWQRQTENWVNITLDFVSDVVVYVHHFISKILRHVCFDVATYKALLTCIMEQLQDRYRAVIEHAKFLLKVERFGTLLTKNHYFNDSLRQFRQERIEKSMNSVAVAATTTNVTKGPVQKMIRVADIQKIVPTGNHEHTIQDIHSILKAYYKVTRKRFVDNVCSQGIDYYLLTGDESPLKVFSPRFILSLTPEQLRDIAGEHPHIRCERVRLMAEIEALEKGRKILRG